MLNVHPETQVIIDFVFKEMLFGDERDFRKSGSMSGTWVLMGIFYSIGSQPFYCCNPLIQFLRL